MQNRQSLSGYMPQLDGLRALAVLGVIAQHFWTPSEVVLPGVLGVYLFFVLSGFLITRILLKCRQENDGLERVAVNFTLRQFYIRRFLRIFPVYYLYLLVIIIMKKGGTDSALGWYALYLGNFFSMRHGWVWPLGHFWSLAVEEQFYLIWPWLVMFAPKRLLGLMMASCVLLGVVSKPLLYLITKIDLSGYVLLPDCLDTLATGGLLALATANGWSKKLETRLATGSVAGLIFIAVGVWAAGRGMPYSIAFCILSAGACLTGAWLIFYAAKDSRSWFGRFLSVTPLRYVGSISYGIYVWHMLVRWPIDFVSRHLHLAPLNSTMMFLAVSVVSVSVAAASWILFERPINNLKRFFPYSEMKTEHPLT